jgi:hypothetical protein
VRLASRLLVGLRGRLGRIHFFGSRGEERLVLAAAFLADIGNGRFYAGLGRSLGGVGHVLPGVLGVFVGSL